MSAPIPLDEMIDTLTHAIPDTQVQEAMGNLFFFAGEERNFPFATLLTRDDDYDNFSQLDRSGAYRLSVGVRKQTFGALFPRMEEEAPEPDYTVLDTLMPHPIYGKMYWLCVLSPSASTYSSMEPLLRESYELQSNRTQRRTSGGEAEA